MGTLEGKVALVTGGSRSRALAAAKRFAEEGAFVFIAGPEQKELEKAQAELGRNVMAIVGDVTNLGDVERLYSVVRDVKGHIDIVFAGEAQPVTSGYFDGIFNVDVRGVLFTVDGALPLMREGGSIMIDGAIADADAGGGKVGSEAQGAIRALARDWTFDLANRRIRACVTRREDCYSCAAA